MKFKTLSREWYCLPNQDNPLQACPGFLPRQLASCQVDNVTSLMASGGSLSRRPQVTEERVQNADADTEADHFCKPWLSLSFPELFIHSSLVLWTLEAASRIKRSAACSASDTPLHMSPQVQKSPPSLPRWSLELCSTARLG